MSYGDKYGPLRAYLRKVKEDYVVLSFGEIESVIGDYLPDSAWTHTAWWVNNGHYHAVWNDVHFETINISENIRCRRMEFVRTF
ncbi:MAG: hypothetical protein LBD03_08025 [Methanobrevibacter sp.]|jgi:hypothetical protein|nr:hypothetical protein [Candidatus Methanovirga procula]